MRHYFNGLLGAQPILGGVIGDDSEARELVHAAENAGIDGSGLVSDPSRPTTVKMRILARGQQVARVDIEASHVLADGIRQQLIAWAVRAAADVDAVLVSDYAKGTVSSDLVEQVVIAARRYGRSVIVDPKGSVPERYRGASIVKPNLQELASLTDRPVATLDSLVSAARYLASTLPGTHVLVTRGADGMVLIPSDAAPLYLPAASPRYVFDVTGAGDTVSAVLALALGAGLDVYLAARLANVAASVVVGKVATSVITPSEMLAALGQMPPEFLANPPVRAPNPTNEKPKNVSFTGRKSDSLG